MLKILLVTGAGSVLQTRAHQKFSDGAMISWKMPLVSLGCISSTEAPEGAELGGCCPVPTAPTSHPLGLRWAGQTTGVVVNNEVGKVTS